MNFGSGPLSHPLIVKAAETEFVPVAVYNNVKGPDEDVLKAFKEPAWNNPVLRFLDAEKADLIPRQENVYSPDIVVLRMIAALEAAKKPVPEYLSKASRGEAAKSAKATFAMECYWEGEAKFGSLAGVIATRIGMLQGKEAVEVTYDEELIDYSKLVAVAKKFDCTHRVFARTDAELKIARGLVGDKAVKSDEKLDDSTQQQYHLAQIPKYHFLPLTAFQATKVNACLAFRVDPEPFLAADQREIFKRFDKVTDAEYKSIKALKPLRTDDGRKAYAKDLKAVLK